MRVVLKLLIVLLLGMLIYAVVIIPKVLSWVWYGKWDLHGTEDGLHDAIGELIFEIIIDEDFTK